MSRYLLVTALLVAAAAPAAAITLAERLHNASVAGDKKALTKALNDGAPLDGMLGEERVTALMAAAAHGKTGSIKQLLKAKAAVDLRDASGGSALLYCGHPRAKSQDQGELEAAARLLLKAGADPNGPDKKGWRPLMAAAAARNKGLVEALLDAGANPGSKNAAGQTALHVAKEAGDEEIYRTLREAGAR